MLPSRRVYFYEAKLFNDKRREAGVFVQSERFYIAGARLTSGAGSVRPAMGCLLAGAVAVLGGLV